MAPVVRAPIRRGRRQVEVPWILMQVDQQGAPAKFIQLFHGRALQHDLARTSLFPRRDPAHHQSADLKGAQRNPILRIANCKL